MQLEVAKAELSSKKGNRLCNIERAAEFVSFGLAEARRYAYNWRLNIDDGPGLTVTLQHLVKRSSMTGRLCCNFRSENIPENSLSPRVQHELFRIVQEAIHNAVRHANPTPVWVSLRRDDNKLELQIRDDGQGIPPAQLLNPNGFGLINMRNRAKRIAASLDIRSGAGTAIVVRLPINA